MQICLYDNIFELITKVLDDEGTSGYVIGGYVRDRLMDRKTDGKDIDILVIGDGIAIARKVAKLSGKNTKVTVFKTYGTAMFMHEGKQIEFVGARKESYSRESRKPSVSVGTLEDDQNRRDFTINAIAISLNSNTLGTIVDPFNGIKDIEDKIIKTPQDPDKTFSDDPLRMVRAVRFATQLGFTIDEHTLQYITRNRDRIEIVSVERITIELNKIIESNKPSTGFRSEERRGG